MSTMRTAPAPVVPDKIPSQGSLLSPEWIHAITTLMDHPLSSEKIHPGMILFHAVHDLTDFWLSWDPTDDDDIRLLQKYVEHIGSIVYLPSSTVKNLISLGTYMNLLIRKERPTDQKCSFLYFIFDDQWFNLTAHDMRNTLANAGLEYHESQTNPGTSMYNFTSPAPMRPPYPFGTCPIIQERYQTR